MGVMGHPVHVEFHKILYHCPTLGRALHQEEVPVRLRQREDEGGDQVQVGAGEGEGEPRQQVSIDFLHIKLYKLANNFGPKLKFINS